MQIKNMNRAQLETALRNTNTKHGYRLIWKDIRALNLIGTRWQLTIRSEKSRIRGARTSWTGRNIPAASWHAHGHFFEEVLAVNPEAVIRTGLTGEKIITKDGGNWQDSRVGSQACPVMMSELSIL